MTNKYFIKKIHLKKGTLRNQLEIPTNKNIPITLLNKIESSKLKRHIKNPTKTGKKKISVTKLLKERVTLALNFRRMRRR